MDLHKLFSISLLFIICMSCKSAHDKRFNSNENGIICTIDSISAEFIYIQPQAVFHKYLGNRLPTKNYIDIDGTVKSEDYTYQELTQNGFSYSLDLLKYRKVQRSFLFEYQPGEMPKADNITNTRYVIVYSGRYDDYLIGFAIFELTKKREKFLKERYWISTNYF